MQILAKPPHGSLQWLTIRHRDDDGNVTFGASEAGALIGVSEYTTLADLCVSKLRDPEEKEPEPQMVKGIIFEEPLLQEAARRLDADVRTPNVMYRKGRFTVTLDGLVYQGIEPVAIVEAKVTSAYAVSSPDDLPASWLAQGHVQEWVLGLPVYFIVFDKRQHINLIPMPFRSELMQQIWQTAETVGASLDAGEIPAMVAEQLTADHVQQLYPVVERRSITATNDIVDLVFDLETTRNQIKQLKDQESSLVDAIARVMGDADEITDAHGFTMLTWRQQKGRASFDTKAFQQAHPDLFTQFTKEGAPYRVMRFGKGNK